MGVVHKNCVLKTVASGSNWCKLVGWWVVERENCVFH